MTILSKMETGHGGNWILVDYGNNFYAYGLERDLHSLFGFPVDQYGTKDEVKQHCNLISRLCRRNIEKYNREISKSDKPDGWKYLIEQEEKQLEMLTEFARILT